MVNSKKNVMADDFHWTAIAKINLPAYEDS